MPDTIDRPTPLPVAAVMEQVSPSPEDAPSESGSAHNKAIVDGVLWLGASRWLAQVVAWSATFVVARKLSAEDYGIAGTVGVLIGLLTLMLDSGMGRALILMREKREEIVGQVHGASVLVGIGMMLVMMAIAVPTARFYNDDRIIAVILVQSPLMVLSGINAVPMSLLQQRLEYRSIALVEFGKAIVQGVVVLSCALAGMRYWSLGAGLIAGYITSVALVVRISPVTMRWPSFAQIAHVVSYARHVAVSAISWYLYTNSDFAVVGHVAGLTALGLYQFAWNIAQLPGEKLGNVLQSVVGPFFGSIGDDVVALRHYFLLSSELLVAVMLPVLGGFALVSPIAIPLFFGAKWLDAVPMLQVLIGCAAIGSLAQLGQHVLGAVGQANVNARINLIALCILPPCFYAAARLYGPLAVALTWVVAQPLLVGIPLLRMRRIIHLSVMEYLIALRGPIVSSVAMALCVLAARHYSAGLDAWLRLGLLCGAGAVVYIAIFVTIFPDRIAALRALRAAR